MFIMNVWCIYKVLKVQLHQLKQQIEQQIQSQNPQGLPYCWDEGEYIADKE